jgi:putative CocE/NonD family hydrolase
MRRRPLFLVAFVAGVAVVVTALVVVLHAKPTTTLGSAVSGATQIQGYGGTKISAHVYLPSGPGPHPLLIIPGSWGAPADRYKYVAKLFTDDGYVVLSYAQRGIGASQGEIDLGGDLTQRDVSRMITWSINHEPVDPNRVAALGLSYGAGASLLAAERDSRIKAVVAMSAWTNLLQAYFPNGTPNRLAIQTLYGPQTIARLSPEAARFHTAFAAGDYAAAQADISALSPSRSAITGIAALNRNHTAVMIANDYQDSYFVPSQLTTFFDQLTGPKRLQLAPGDHGGQELAGLNGQPSAVWDNARRWLDHYVLGVTNNIDTQLPVQLQDMTTGVVHGYRAFPVSGVQTAYLGGGDAGALTSLASAASSGWARTITAGVPTIANLAPIELGVVPYRPLTGLALAAVSRTAAGVWQGTALPVATTIAGQPSVHLTVTLSATTASLFVHLYDVNPFGLASLITSSAYSMAGNTPNAPTSVDVPLEPIAWTVPAGHHVALVIDTVDTKFATLSSPGQTITFSSPAKDPSRLSIPTS